MAGGEHGTKAVIAALLANLGIAGGKLAGFVITGSASMLAESIHSLADSGNQALLLLGSKRARRAADREHPFGYGRERYFWAFVVALVLFALGGAFAIYEGVSKLRHPHHVDSPEVAVGILALAVLLEGLSFRTAVKEARKIKGDAGWWRFIRRSKNPELPVVLLEDFGALVGLVLALVAVGLTLATDDPMWDGAGTVGIGVLLTVIAVILAVEMKSLLIGESADKTVRETIRSAVEIEPAVERLIHLRTQHLGPEELFVGVKVSFIGDLSLREVADAVNRIEANVRANVPTVGIMYVEPEVMRTDLPPDLIDPSDLVAHGALEPEEHVPRHRRSVPAE
jgi:cation diffusion facilitator family transporter